MGIENMYAVDEYFDGELVEEHLFLTCEELMHSMSVYLIEQNLPTMLGMNLEV